MCSATYRNPGLFFCINYILYLFYWGGWGMNWNHRSDHFHVSLYMENKFHFTITSIIKKNEKGLYLSRLHCCEVSDMWVKKKWNIKPLKP